MHATDWESPLKKPNLGSTPPHTPVARPKRLFSQASEPPKTRTLSDLYNFNLDNPPFIDKDRQFFAVRNVVEDIENVLEMQADRKKVAPWRDRVSRTLNVKEFDKKMAELGAILFYISKDEYNLERLEVTPSLMQYRALELQQEVMRYTAAGSDSPIPSGKIHYLMRAFAHMVITKNHVYNQGGLIAIRELLSNPQYKLAHYLQPEHREHILTVIQQLLSKSGTANLFNTRFAIHESLKDLIRIDLKLDSKSPIDSILILYDCLMALFADVRQFEYPNCYAIATFIYSTENHTGKILHTMLDWLKTGYYTFDNKVSIPIRPLLEGRLASCKDFSVTVNPDSLVAFAPIGHIQSTLSLKAPRVRTSTPLPLDEALRTLLPDSSKPEQLSYVTKLYNGFKHNALVTMNIALLEFENSNLASTNEVKEQLILACIAAVKNSVKYTIKYQKIEKLGDSLEEKLWLQPCYEKKVVMKDGTIQVGSSEVISPLGNERSLEDLLHSSMRLFTLENGQFRPVHSISALRAIVTSAMQKVGIMATLDKEIFANQIAQACQNQISSSFTITAATLKAHDLVIFCQNGGYGSVVLDHVYKISAQRAQIQDAATAYAFLEKLFKLIKTATVTSSREVPKLLIHSNNTSTNHQWTVNTKCWKVFSSCKKFHPFMQHNIFTRANQRLDSQVPQNVFMSIVRRYTDNQKTVDALNASYASLDKPTYRDLLDLLKCAIPLADKEKIRAIVDDEFSKVTISKNQLSYVLRTFDSTMDTPTFNKIYNSVNKGRNLPFLLARDIYFALSNNKIAVIDPSDIERELCKVTQLPLPISIGDTNWTDDDTEDPSHTTLWTRFSYWDNTLGYFVRTKSNERRTLNKRYRNIVIHHPVK